MKKKFVLKAVKVSGLDTVQLKRISAWRNAISEAMKTGDLKGLANVIRHSGGLGLPECDDLADLMDATMLTLKSQKPDREYRLALAAEEVRRLEKMSRMKLKPDGRIQLIKHTRPEGIERIVAKWGRRWGFDRDTLEEQLNNRRSAARLAKKNAAIDGRDWPGGTQSRLAGRPKKKSD